MSYIAQGKRSETLSTYTRLTQINPGMARDLKEKMRGKPLPNGISLPD